MTKSSCIDCPDHKPGCQDHCEHGVRMAREAKERREKIRGARDVVVNGYKYNAVGRSRKTAGR